MEFWTVRFSTITYPQGLEYNIEPVSGSTTGITFLPVRTINYIDEEPKILADAVQQLWRKFNLDKDYILIPKKQQNDFS